VHTTFIKLPSCSVGMAGNFARIRGEFAQGHLYKLPLKFAEAVSSLVL